MKNLFLYLTIAVVTFFSGNANAQDLWSQSLGSRGLGFGDGIIATGTGADALASNPAGMGLIKSYIWENFYRYNSSVNTHLANTAFVDSYINERVAAGAYYTHRYGTREIFYNNESQDIKENLAKGGVAISIKFTDYLILGVNGYYYDWEFGDQAKDGISMDAGAIVALGQNLFFGLTAYDLFSDHSDSNPWSFGAGAGLKLLSGKIITEFDTVMEGKEFWFRGGAEFFTSSGLAFRAGGGYRQRYEQKYLTAGVGYIKPKSSIEVGVRKDFSGSDAVYFGIDIRIFIH